jgi:hypothetical protein
MNFMQKKSLFSWATLLVATLSALACTKVQTGGGLSVQPDYLEIKGKLLDEEGKPVSEANVFIADYPTPDALSEQNGEFRVRLRDHEITRQIQRSGGSEPTMRLVFEKRHTEGLISGVSSKTLVQTGMQRDLGNIVLKKPVTVTGRVLGYANGRVLDPLAGAIVKTVRNTIVTDSAGRFVLNEISAGIDEIFISKDGYQDRWQAIPQLTKTENLLPDLVMFRNADVNGHVSVSLLPDPATLDPQHPYQARFFVQPSPSAKYFRYHHDLNSFHNESESSNWKAVQTEFVYDFPSSGGQKLYVQFADENKSIKSDLISVLTVIDIFSGTIGFQINGGSEKCSSLRVKLNMFPPPLSTHFRVSEDIDNLHDTEAKAIPFMPVVRETDFIFGIGTNLTSTLKLLFVQYKTADGNLSPVYRQSITIDPFPLMENVLTINGGQSMTVNKVVELTINAPENAKEMVIFEEVTSGGVTFVSGFAVQMAARSQLEKYWLQVQNKIQFSFLDVGIKNLYIKFRDRDRIESPVYSTIIQVHPFPPDGSPGFRLNGGASVSPSRVLDIQPMPPQGAQSMRVAVDELRELQGGNSLELRDHIQVKADHTGLTTVYVQYIDVTGVTSHVYSQNILIDPFFGQAGQLIINGGSGVTNNQILQVAVAPPQGAVMMQWSLNEPLGDMSPWAPTMPQLVLQARRSGLQTVYARFKSVAGDMSAVTVASIIYDPFSQLINGISLNGGSPIALQSQVPVQVLTPSAVVRMRYSHDQAALEHQPWLVAEPNFIYSFPDRTGMVSLYIQFQTVDGDISSVQYRQIYLDLFPLSNMNFTIASGATTTATRQVSLQFVPPPSAYSVQIGEDPSSIGSSPMRPAVTNLPIILSDVDGLKTVYLRYVTVFGTSSPVVSQSITLDMTP